MQLLRLQLTNFRQYEHADVAFGSGLTGIIGPNGAGKTTLLEAIAYALYGVPGSRGTRDTLRRRRAAPRARFEVVLDFSLGRHRYSLTRTLTTAELTQDGEAIANSTIAVTERVAALLGMTRDEFFNTYFTGQKELAVMAAMGRTERSQFLSRVLGYDRLRDAQDRLRAERSAFKSELAGIEQVLTDPLAIEAELANVTAALAQARAERDAAAAAERAAADGVAARHPDWVAARERRSAWQGLDGERRVVEGRVAAARARFEALDRELADALRARARLGEVAAAAAEWTVLAAEREQLDQLALQHHARGQSAARRDEARRRFAELDPQLAALPDAGQVAALAAARASAVAARELAERQLADARTRWTQDVQEARTKLDGFRDRYRELKEQRALIERQGPDGICPTCGRPLGREFPAMLALLSRQMEEVETDGQYYRQRVEQLGDAPGDVRELQTERERLDQELRRATEAFGQAQAQTQQRQLLAADRARLAEELSRLDAELAGPATAYNASRHADVRARLAQLEPLRREHDQLSGLAHRAETLLASATAAEQQASAVEAELAAVDRRLAALAWDPDAFAATEAAVGAAEAGLQAARIAVARTGAAVDAAERLRGAALARQADRAVKADKARVVGTEIAVLDELDRAFSDLRTELNLQLRPELAERASGLLRDLTAGRYTDLDLDEGYVPTIVEDGEAKPVISGGEEDVVNLALRLAISQMIADRAGQPLSVLVLDEIFGSLDEERRGSVLELLRALSDRFPQVILITHVEGMRDAFDRLLRASYDPETGVTTLRDETLDATDVAA